ncbi:MAG: GH25 family lysozyme, partial [Jatrophihabitantaceae bacterium]
IYTNSYWWDPCTASNATFAASPLITAHYNGSPTPLPTGWADWTFWQYTSTASVPGIVGDVDADVFNGTLADFAPLTGSPLVNGKYLSYAYIAASRQGAAVYVNGLVKQGSAKGLIRSPLRTVYLQRNLDGVWQTVLSRVTDWDGVFTVGFICVPTYQYRFVVSASGSAWGTTSGVASPPIFKYASYAYIAASRHTSAVSINGLVKQGSATGIIRSAGRTIYLQRNLGGSWQTMLSRVTDGSGVFTVGFVSVTDYQYRYVVTASETAAATTSGVATTTPA